ncbi:hypothetical protein [Epilithonimonas sp. UC225_85]|uniref:hypothetical protein n=1 Tax=Epilithonimonas sp. UC225_85 TaxID=3350167 RepID=UPI0036D26CE8
MKIRFLLIFLGIIICFGCEKKLTYQPPKENLTDLIELALKLCDDGNKEQGFLKDKKVFYLQSYHFKNPLQRKIRFRKRLVNLDIINYKNREYECLITLIKYKKISKTKFYLSYFFDGSDVDHESFIEYKNNQWVIEKCVSTIY